MATRTKHGTYTATPPAGQRVSSEAVPRFTSSGEPCSSDRKGCPLQLVFKDGKPFLRMCPPTKRMWPGGQKSARGKLDRRGPLVAVSSPADAVAKGRSICACWETTRDFRKCEPGGEPWTKQRAQSELGKAARHR